MLKPIEQLASYQNHTEPLVDYCLILDQMPLFAYRALNISVVLYYLVIIAATALLVLLVWPQLLGSLLNTVHNHLNSNHLTLSELLIEIILARGVE
jgi:hypothetical protein